MDFKTRVTLLERLKSKHDQNAWSDFYDNYHGYIGAVISNLNVTPSDIDDLIQKVMLVSWEKIPEFEYNQKKGLFRSWLIRITKNIVMNYFSFSDRNSKKMQAFTEDQLNKNELQIDNSADKEWRIHISKLAWQSIRDNYQENARNVFDLVTQGNSNKDIAEKLDLKQNTVAVFKKRITEALKDEIIRLDEFLA
jgi:RNA polymerase sigma factor (sigma-70 family)